MLNVRVDVVMRAQHSFTFLEQAPDAFLQHGFFCQRRCSRGASPRLGGATGAAIHLRTFKFDGFDGLSLHGPVELIYVSLIQESKLNEHWRHLPLTLGPVIPTNIATGC